MAAIRAKGDRPPANPGELSPAAVTTQCLAAWRMTQGIYRIDSALYAALIDTPITGDIPADVLLYMPEWCVYIETPGMTVPVRDAAPSSVLGLWYWLDAAPGRGMILCIGIDTGRRPPIIAQHVPLVGTIEAAIEATLREWEDAIARGNANRAPPPEYAAAARAWLPPALSLILYLCSEAADISGRHGTPGNPQPQRTRRYGERLRSADGIRTWDVGMRVGAALRRDQEAAAHGVGAGKTHYVLPHIRRAHWHTYLLGPHGTLRRRDLRWIPPILVAVDDIDALPAVAHPVGTGDSGNALLRVALNEAGLTTHAAAEHLGLNARTLRRMISGALPIAADDPIIARARTLAGGK
jgi:hypothetical protein